MRKVHVKKNDKVRVLTGKDRGVEGKVLRVLPGEGRAIVEGVNFIKRHTKPNPNRQIQGGILEKEASLRLDNLMVICPACNKPSRLGRKRLEDGSGVRFCKNCNATLS